MAVLTLEGGDMLPEIKIKTIANFTSLISDGSLTAADYNLDIGGLSILAIRQPLNDLFSVMDREALVQGVASQGTLTLDTIPLVNDGCVIGGSSYLFVASATDAGDVEIGSLSETQVNLKAAIDGNTENVENATVTTVGTWSTNVLTLIAKATGVAGDLIVTTQTFDEATNVFDGDTLGTAVAGVDADGFTETLDGGELLLNTIRTQLNTNFVHADSVINP